eukprot:TRINITY_DN13249_c0_g1_i1.p1 TRINITY_DN13249_c0_g1~~TRINITY_DN13249_c0_g1_i1.p1  ORF type:complete len:552 (+),score=50.96 TRINITY_DN13249_c0_g1_i1:35-1690(+)
MGNKSSSQNPPAYGGGGMSMMGMGGPNINELTPKNKEFQAIVQLLQSQFQISSKSGMAGGELSVHRMGQVINPFLLNRYNATADSHPELQDTPIVSTCDWAELDDVGNIPRAEDRDLLWSIVERGWTLRDFSGQNGQCMHTYERGPCLWFAVGKQTLKRGRRLLCVVGRILVPPNTQPEQINDSWWLCTTVEGAVIPEFIVDVEPIFSRPAAVVALQSQPWPQQGGPTRGNYGGGRGTSPPPYDYEDAAYNQRGGGGDYHHPPPPSHHHHHGGGGGYGSNRRPAPYDGGGAGVYEPAIGEGAPRVPPTVVTERTSPSRWRKRKNSTGGDYRRVMDVDRGSVYHGDNRSRYDTQTQFERDDASLISRSTSPMKVHTPGVYRSDLFAPPYGRDGTRSTTAGGRRRSTTTTTTGYARSPSHRRPSPATTRPAHHHHAPPPPRSRSPQRVTDWVDDQSDPAAAPPYQPPVYHAVPPSSFMSGNNEYSQPLIVDEVPPLRDYTEYQPVNNNMGRDVRDRDWNPPLPPSHHHRVHRSKSVTPMGGNVDQYRGRNYSQ